MAIRGRRSAAALPNEIKEGRFPNRPPKATAVLNRRSLILAQPALIAIARRIYLGFFDVMTPKDAGLSGLSVFSSALVEKACSVSGSDEGSEPVALSSRAK
jgi:hypothetical protein